MKERLRGYFRLSSRSSCDKKPNAVSEQRPSDVSITIEATTETCDLHPDDQSSAKKPNKATQYTKPASARKPFQNVSKSKCGIVRSTEVRPNIQPAAPAQRLNSEFSDSLKERLAVAGLFDRTATPDLLNNSCSNITASTYCNGATDPLTLLLNKESPDRELLHNNPMSDSKQAQLERRSARRTIYNHPLRTSQESELDSILSRRESSSTYERDMDIIDLLQRERSMDIPETLERERRSGIDPMVRSISRQNSALDRHHRRLPDVSRFTGIPPASPKKSVERHFPNQVFTHQLSHDLLAAVPVLPSIPVLPSGRGVAVVAAAVAAQSNRSGSISALPTKRDSVNSLGSGCSQRLIDLDATHVLPLASQRAEYRDQRLASNQSSHSSASTRGSSFKSHRLIGNGNTGAVGEYPDSVFNQNL